MRHGGRKNRQALQPDATQKPVRRREEEQKDALFRLLEQEWEERLIVAPDTTTPAEPVMHADVAEAVKEVGGPAMKRCPLVLIEWEDSEQPVGAWLRLADFEPAAPMRVSSVGWLIQDDAEMKALAPNVGGFDANTAQASGIIRIPARCVVSVKRLKETHRTWRA